MGAVRVNRSEESMPHLSCKHDVELMLQSTLKLLLANMDIRSENIMIEVVLKSPQRSIVVSVNIAKEFLQFCAAFFLS